MTLRPTLTQARRTQDVWSYGYPLATTRQGEQQEVIWRLTGRMLRGYVTQGTDIEPSHGGVELMYELDMPSPPGLSGAPLLLGAGRHVVGVVQGEHTATQGNRSTTFALELDLGVLAQSRGAATNGLPLGDISQRVTEAPHLWDQERHGLRPPDAAPSRLPQIHDNGMNPADRAVT